MKGRWTTAWSGVALLLATNVMAAKAQSNTSPLPNVAQANSSAANRDASESQDSSSVSGADIQTPSTTISEPTFGHAFANAFDDQKAIWTSPRRIRVGDASWLVPLGGLTAALFATDSDVSRHLNDSPSTIHRYQQISNYGIAAMAGGGAGLYFLGLVRHDEHERETGFLAGEAAVNGLLVTEALKYATRRERPYLDNANGDFWHGGDSFPSEHATAAWSIAGVIAHEYPGPLPTIAAYGLAAGISVARIEARQHFPSDVLVGSAIGWLVAQYVYKAHHNPDLQGSSWDVPAVRPERPSHWSAKFMGSPYVPIDSWVYPALLRLAALGYIKSDIEGMRPWTRMECARLVEEAGESIEEDGENSKGAATYESLAKEFSKEIGLLAGGDNQTARLESVYTRTTDISGQPLRDGYDFGQTIINDYGRPYAEGVNNITGASAWASEGPFVGYIRGEYQYAPSSPALPSTALQAMSQEEGIPSVPTATPTAATSQFDMLEGYAGMQIDDWQITFGKQEQWWGPDAGGAMLFSNNAQPIEMLQINRTTPFTFPWFLGRMGPIRAQYFLGRIGGYHWLFDTTNGFMGSWSQALADQPFMEGEKFSFRPSRNLEFGLSMTILFSGEGMPFTLHKFFQVLFPLKYGAQLASPLHTGDRQGGFDFRYRLPWVRNWVTFYGDGFTHDEPNPVWGSFDKSAFDAGLYFPHVPKIPKLDFRVEGVFTDNPNPNPVLQHGFFYYETTYRSGYTNDGNLIGNWIGREGQGAQAWATYWFTPKNKLELNYRHQKVSREFVPFGGTVTDGGIDADLWTSSAFSVTASFQYEKWNFPVLATVPQTDLSTSVQFTFWPHLANTKPDRDSSAADNKSVN
jgi:Capsule assembly protein Wzi/PAP2 superfamily